MKMTSLEFLYNYIMILNSILTLSTVKPKNNGTKVTYLQLAHNGWDKGKGHAKADFFDTTSTYMEMDEEDTDGLRRYVHSRDRRPDLPQIVIGLAVAKEGIPVRCWVFPGNTQDIEDC